MAQKQKFNKHAPHSPSAVRSLWTGTINFGLVSIPVRMVPAIRDRSIHFHRVTRDGQCRLRQKLVCPETGKEYDFSETARGYEVAPHQYVVVDEKELASIKPQRGHGVEIFQFVELSEIDPIYFDRPYYLLPEEKTYKPYELLRQIIADERKAALAKMVMHDKQYLIVIRANEQLLWVQTLHFDTEIAPTESLFERHEVKIATAEKTLAAKLVESLTEKFEPRNLKDDYQEKMKHLLEEKGRGKAVHLDQPKSPAHANVVDLMGRLKESLEKKSRSSHNASKPRAGRKSSQRKKHASA